MFGQKAPCVKLRQPDCQIKHFNIKRRKRMKKIFAICALFLILAAAPAKAAQIYWTDWTSKSYGTPGSAAGTITFPGSNVVNVSYVGEIISTGDQGNWDQNAGTYTKAGIVDNQPSPANVSIQLMGGNSIVNTLTFSNPVLNPIMAIQSLGGGNQVYYEFGESFTLLSQGGGHWGGSTTSLSQVGNKLYGKEGNGIIQFTGTYSSISWTVPNAEYYHMFTVGAPSTVPLPGAVLLFAPGLAGLIAVKRRFKK
jgi:hypothetical protein